VLSQAVAPQVASLVEQAAWQQFPVPWMPQTPDRQVALPLHGEPSASPPPVVVPVVVPLVLPLLVTPAVDVPVLVEPEVVLVEAPVVPDELVVLATPLVLLPAVVLPAEPELVVVPPPPQAAASM
jgi:signal-induced proliferation-associated 1 like protein 3